MHPIDERSVLDLLPPDDDTPDPSPEELVAETRIDFWCNGYRPVVVASHDAPCKSPGKQPFLRGWADDARKEVPGCLGRSVARNEANTGVLCDGLRAVDIDVSDPERVARIRESAERILGRSAPVRFRANSPRLLMLYRAASGQPGKRHVGSAENKVEVLGFGQQFVADGRHPTGVQLLWEDDRTPGNVPFYRLPAVSEEQATEFLEEARRLLGAGPEQVPDHAAEAIAPFDSPFSIDDARSACEVIDPQGGDYGRWLRVGAAIHAVDPGPEGGALFDDWSRKAPNYDARAVRDKWRSFTSSPLRGIGAGTLVHMARETYPGWTSSSLQPRESALAERLAAMREAVAVAAADPPPDASRKRRYRMLSTQELAALPPPSWLVPRMLLNDTVGAIYGPPTSYKSFLALHVALSLAHGAEWEGRPLEKVGVAYVAAEGATGAAMRIQAWEKHHGVAGRSNGLIFIPEVVNLTCAEDVGDLIADLREAATPVRLVVLDTLARCSVGVDENSAKEIGVVVDAAIRIRQGVGASVLFVHHTGKDTSRGMRGSNRLLGDLDTAIEVSRAEGSEFAVMSIRKQKDAEEAAPLVFRAVKVSLPLRPGFGPQTSLVMTAEVRADAKRESDLSSIALALPPGESLTVSKLIDRMGWPRGETSYDRIKAAVPTGEPAVVETLHGVRRIVRQSDNTKHGRIVCFDGTTPR